MQEHAERRALRAELKLLAREERSRQQKAAGECLSRAQVVCATLTGCLSHDLDPLAFDLAVVDEAAQVLLGRLALWCSSTAQCPASALVVNAPLDLVCF